MRDCPLSSHAHLSCHQGTYHVSAEAGSLLGLVFCNKTEDPLPISIAMEDKKSQALLLKGWRRPPCLPLQQANVPPGLINALAEDAVIKAGHLIHPELIFHLIHSVLFSQNRRKVTDKESERIEFHKLPLCYVCHNCLSSSSPNGYLETM